ncbi:MAG: AmpG family muropeptide MFS transporter [Rhodospirillales bacterium]|nr:AmpG family muropeptide MFS transporter [Alphaproteobacteria bacterium]MBL6948419.1 AmpG family muropeptide MFS transporter [Rhodospirillales bacterium]
MKTWLEAARVYGDRRILIILVLGFSSGLPLLLVFSTLSFWLTFEGVSLTAIGLFSLVRMPYTLKFLWAPLIDRVRLPVISDRLGRRRSWALVSQILLMVSIFGLALSSPAENPWLTAFFALLVAFASASQDIVIDAYRVEVLADDEQGAGAGAIVLGYRMGMLTAGAGALWLAAAFSWSQVYAIMGVLVAIGMVAVLMAREPETGVSVKDADVEEARIARHLESGVPPWLARLLASFYEGVVAPFKDFMTRPAWAWALAFIALYKLGESYLGVMAGPFYVALGFTTVEIANVTKVFGLAAIIIGGLIGGIMVARIGIMRSLMICGVLQIAGTCMFAVQAKVGHSVPMLMVTITAENVTSGMATSAFVAYLSSLCHQAYTATQYALLSSLTAFSRDILSASAGWAAEQVDWAGFFLISAAAAVPGLLVLAWIMRGYPPDAGSAEAIKMNAKS